jgi:hypothetical protein
MFKNHIIGSPADGWKVDSSCCESGSRDPFDALKVLC